jgi:PEP-CTERM motif
MGPLPTSRRASLRGRSRRRLFLGAAIAILLLAGAVFRLSRSVVSETPGGLRSVALAADTEPATLADTSVLERDRAIYPYSIIPGGARSREALLRSIESDPVVRAHYANFDVASTRVVRLTQPRIAYVSYRMGSAVYWTRRPVVLKAGETVLTDGTHYARTRCGNQLAAAPAVTSEGEPPAELLNTPLPLLHRALWVPKLPMFGQPAGATFFGIDVPMPMPRGIASIPGFFGTVGIPDRQPSLEGDASPFPYNGTSDPPAADPQSPVNEPPTYTPPPSDPLPPSGLPPTLVPPDDPTPPDTPPNPPVDPPTDPPTDPPPPEDPPVPVPEPGSWLLLAAGAGFALRRRKVGSESHGPDRIDAGR